MSASPKGALPECRPIISQTVGYVLAAVGGLIVGFGLAFDVTIMPPLGGFVAGLPWGPTLLCAYINRRLRNAV